jgi:hypothetical protein
VAGIKRRARVELVDGGILIRPGDDERIGMGVAGEASDGNEGDDSSYTSLYSADPPALNGNGRVKGKRWLWRRAKQQ